MTFEKKNSFNRIEFVQLSIFVLSIVGVVSSNILSDILNWDSSYLSFLFRSIFLILCLFLLVNSKTKEIIKNKYFQLFLLFFLFYVARIITDTIIFPKHLEFSTSRYYLYTFGVVVVPSIVFNFRLKKSIQEKAFSITIYILFIVCIYSLIIYHFESVNGSLRLWGGNTIHPITLGNIAVTNIILSLYFIVNNKSVKLKRFMFVNIFISIITLFFTESRGPILSLFIVLFLFQFFIYRFNRKSNIIFILIISVSMLVLVFFTEFNKRVIFTLTHGGARIEIWQNTINQILNNPIWGSSLEVDVINIYPHNILLESFLTTGILGGIIFVLLMIIFLEKGYSVLRIGKLRDKWISLLFIQIFISSMFSNSIITNSSLWYFGMLVMNIGVVKDRNNNKFILDRIMLFLKKKIIGK